MPFLKLLRRNRLLLERNLRVLLRLVLLRLCGLLVLLHRRGCLHRLSRLYRGHLRCRLARLRRWLLVLLHRLALLTRLRLYLRLLGGCRVVLGKFAHFLLQDLGGLA